MIEMSLPSPEHRNDDGERLESFTSVDPKVIVFGTVAGAEGGVMTDAIPGKRPEHMPKKAGSLCLAAGTLAGPARTASQGLVGTIRQKSKRISVAQPCVKKVVGFGFLGKYCQKRSVVPATCHGQAKRVKRVMKISRDQTLIIAQDTPNINGDVSSTTEDEIPKGDPHTKDDDKDDASMAIGNECSPAESGPNIIRGGSCITEPKTNAAGANSSAGDDSFSHEDDPSGLTSKENASRTTRHDRSTSESEPIAPDNLNITDESIITENNSSTTDESRITENNSSTRDESGITENNSSTTDESIITENNSSTRDESGITENNSSTRDESGITENNSSTRDESIITENNSSTTDESRITENNSSTMDESRITENNSSTTDESRITENNSSTRDESRITENNSSTRDESRIPENNSSTTDESRITENNSSTTDESRITENNSSTTDESIITENNSSTTDESRITESNSSTTGDEPGTLRIKESPAEGETGQLQVTVANATDISAALDEPSDDLIIIAVDPPSSKKAPLAVIELDSSDDENTKLPSQPIKQATNQHPIRSSVSPNVKDSSKDRNDANKSIQPKPWLPLLNIVHKPNPSSPKEQHFSFQERPYLPHFPRGTKISFNYRLLKMREEFDTLISVLDNLVRPPVWAARNPRMPFEFRNFSMYHKYLIQIGEEIPPPIPLIRLEYLREEYDKYMCNYYHRIDQQLSKSINKPSGVLRDPHQFRNFDDYYWFLVSIGKEESPSLLGDAPKPTTPLNTLPTPRPRVSQHANATTKPNPNQTAITTPIVPPNASAMLRPNLSHNSDVAAKPNPSQNSIAKSNLPKNTVASQKLNVIPNKNPTQKQVSCAPRAIHNKNDGTKTLDVNRSSSIMSRGVELQSTGTPKPNDSLATEVVKAINSHQTVNVTQKSNVESPACPVVMEPISMNESIQTKPWLPLLNVIHRPKPTAIFKQSFWFQDRPLHHFPRGTQIPFDSRLREMKNEFIMLTSVIDSLTRPPCQAECLTRKPHEFRNFLMYHKYLIHSGKEVVHKDGAIAYNKLKCLREEYSKYMRNFEEKVSRPLPNVTDIRKPQEFRNFDDYYWYLVCIGKEKGPSIKGNGQKPTISKNAPATKQTPIQNIIPEKTSNVLARNTIASQKTDACPNINATQMQVSCAPKATHNQSVVTKTPVVPESISITSRRNESQIKICVSQIPLPPQKLTNSPKMDVAKNKNSDQMVNLTPDVPESISIMSGRNESQIKICLSQIPLPPQKPTDSPKMDVAKNKNSDQMAKVTQEFNVEAQPRPVARKLLSKNDYLIKKRQLVAKHKEEVACLRQENARLNRKVAHLQQLAKVSRVASHKEKLLRELHVRRIIKLDQGKMRTRTVEESPDPKTAIKATETSSSQSTAHLTQKSSQIVVLSGTSSSGLASTQARGSSPHDIDSTSLNSQPKDSHSLSNSSHNCPDAEASSPNSRLFILCDKTITEADLRQHFGQHGIITDMSIVKDRITGDPKGTAYVKYAKTSQAIIALARLDGRCIRAGTKPIKVLIAKDTSDASDQENGEQECLLRLLVVVPKVYKEDEIRKHFSKFGEVSDVAIFKNSDTNDGKTRACVRFTNELAATKAFKNCDQSFCPVFTTFRTKVTPMLAQKSPDQHSPAPPSIVSNHPDMHDTRGRSSRTKSPEVSEKSRHRISSSREYHSRHRKSSSREYRSRSRSSSYRSSRRRSRSPPDKERYYSPGRTRRSRSPRHYHDSHSDYKRTSQTRSFQFRERDSRRRSSSRAGSPQNNEWERTSRSRSSKERASRSRTSKERASESRMRLPESSDIVTCQSEPSRRLLSLDDKERGSEERGRQKQGDCNMAKKKIEVRELAVSKHFVCCICKLEVEDKLTMQTHLKSETHRKCAEMWKAGSNSEKKAFLCYMCKKSSRCEEIFRLHLDSRDHMEKEKKIIQYFCSVCNVKYANKDIYIDHLQSEGHLKREAEIHVGVMNANRSTQSSEERSRSQEPDEDDVCCDYCENAELCSSFEFTDWEQHFNVIRDSPLFCDHCYTRCGSEKTFYDHLTSRRHLESRKRAEEDA